MSSRNRRGLASLVIMACVSLGAVARETGRNGADEPRLALPSVNIEAVGQEDLERQRNGLPPRYAIPMPMHIKPDTDGVWENLGNGTLAWRLRVGSQGARSINLGFTRYHMPRGGVLTVRAADNSHVIRPFTDQDNESHGQLWTPPIRTDEIVIELTIPESALPMLDLELNSVNVGYRGFGDVVAAASGSCNVDVVCPEGDGWRDQIPSVAVISTGGFTFCTGFMVNNTARDQKPYFMTAFHCGINAGNAASLVTFWNYENSVCRPPGSPASGGPGDGSLSQFQTGAFFRSGYSASDFTLVELDEDPDPTWEVAFAGWDRSNADGTGAVAIHHPNTDEKRISFENDPTTTTSYLGGSSPGDGTHIRVLDWDLGTTEGGSSGSPLFNQDHRVVGQLHGGFAACGNNDADWYGRFSRSWTGGGSSSSRLSNWLDPGNTGEIFIDHISGGGINVTPGDDVLHFGDAGGPFTNPTVTYTLSNPTSTPLDYEVSLTADFGILIDGGITTVAGTLGAGGGTTDVIVSLGTAIDSLTSGVYFEEVVFSDLTNGLTQTRRHTVEIGQTYFSVQPDTDLASSGPVGGPFTDSIVYTVTSERPTPVSVKIASTQAWISLDGGTGPIVLNLNGTGDSATITVGFSSAADSLGAGGHNGLIEFTNLSGTGGNTTRGVTLEVGRLVYGSTDTPQPINDNSTTTSTIVVADNFCIADVDVDVDITHTWIGDLIVELRSPAGTVVRLHDRTGSSTDDIVQTYDDEGIAPDGPGAMSDFDAEQSIGIWTLTVSDNASQDTGTLNHWGLGIAPLGGSCQDCNNNGVPDDEDIALGTSFDCNLNTVLDECECVPVDAPQPTDPVVASNRYLTVVPDNAGCHTAIRVTLSDMPPAFQDLEGNTYWAGIQGKICENSGQGAETQAPADCGPAPGLDPVICVAKLQCTPVFENWTGCDSLHLYGGAVVPGGIYSIQAIDDACDTSVESNYSAALDLATGRWGDVSGNFVDGRWSDPDGNVDVISDAVACLSKFANSLGAPSKVRADLEPNSPNLIIGITDVLKVIEAFQGFEYALAGPSDCPQ